MGKLNNAIQLCLMALSVLSVIGLIALPMIIPSNPITIAWAIMGLVVFFLIPLVIFNQIEDSQYSFGK